MRARARQACARDKQSQPFAALYLPPVYDMLTRLPCTPRMDRVGRERRVVEDGGGGARVVGDVSLNWANGPKPVPGFRSAKTTAECHAVAAAAALTNLLALPVSILLDSTLIPFFHDFTSVFYSLLNLSYWLIPSRLKNFPEFSFLALWRLLALGSRVILFGIIFTRWIVRQVKR